ncbi:MAG: Large cysteine-rich periplasmic protein omcB precursor [Bacteroidota bacterium]
MPLCLMLVCIQWLLTAQNTDLSITITPNSPTFAKFTQIGYTITVKNVGAVNATNVTVAFPKPTNASFVCANASAGAWFAWLAAGPWNIGNLVAGDSARLKTVLYALSDTIVVTASVTSTVSGFIDPVLSNNSFTSTVTTGAAAPAADCVLGGGTLPSDKIDLELTTSITNPEVPFNLNAPILVKIKNNSLVTATGVQVKDSLSAGLVLQNFDGGGGTYNPTTGIWDVGTLAPGNERILLVAAKVTQGGALRNIAQVIAANQVDVDSAPNNFNLNAGTHEDDETILNMTGMLVDMELSMSLENTPLPVKLGDTVTYVVTLHNAGPARGDGTKVRTNIPAGLQYISSIADIGEFDPVTGVWLFSHIADPATGNKPGFTLAAGGTVSIRLKTKALQLGNIDFTCEMRSCNYLDIDSTPSNFVSTEDDQATVLINVVQNTTNAFADLELSHNVTLTPLVIGDSIRYIIGLFNRGPNATTGVTVKCSLATNINNLAIIPSVGSYNATTNIWTIGNLANQATATLTIQGSAGCWTLPNKSFAQVQTSDLLDIDSNVGNNPTNNPVEDDETAQTFNAVNCNTNYADLELSMMANPTTVALNTVVTFNLSVLNRGLLTATGVSLKDILPPQLTFNSATPSVGIYDTATGIWTIGTVNVNSTVTLSITATVNTLTNSIINFAQIQTSTPTDPDSTPGNDSNQTADEDDEAKVTLFSANANQCDLELSLTCPYTNALPIYQNVPLRAVLINRGPAAATGVTVKYPFPTGMAFNSQVVSQGNYASFTGLWTVGTIAPGDSAVLTVTVFTLQTTISAFIQVKTASPTDIDSTPGNDTNNSPNEDDEALLSVPTTSSNPFIDLALNMLADKSSVLPNGNVTFTIAVDNSGTMTATNVSVKHLIPNQLSYKTITPQKGTFDTLTGIWNVGSLLANETANLTILYNVGAITGNIVGFAQVQTATQTNDPDSTPGNNTTGIPTQDDEDNITVFKQGTGTTCDLELTMPTPATYTQYVAKNFNLTLRNTGGVAATNVSVDFPFPTKFVNGGNPTATAGTSYNTFTHIWNVGTLNSGQTVTMTMPLFCLDNTGPVTAFAQVKTASPTDIDSSPGNNTTNVPSEDDEAAIIMTQASGNQPRFSANGTQQVSLVIKSIFPNPGEGEMNVIVNSNYKGEATFEWYSALTGVVFTTKTQVNEGENDLFFDLTGFANGIYFLQTTIDATKQMPIKYIKF